MVTDRAPSSNVVYWLDDRLYLNITNCCTNDCYFCLRKFKKGIAGFNLRLKKEPSDTRILHELKNVTRRKWKEYVFCGFGEPTLRLDALLQASRWIKSEKSGRVRVDTNGHGLLIHPGRSIFSEFRKAGVDKIAVSLNAHTESLYNEVCRPRFQNAFPRVLEFIERAKDSGIAVEITAVTLPEVNVSAVKHVAERMKVGFRARPYISMIR